MNTTNLVIYDINRTGWMVTSHTKCGVITLHAVRLDGSVVEHTESCGDTPAEEYRAVCRLAIACGVPAASELAPHGIES
jgi:hypothetical protein